MKYDLRGNNCLVHSLVGLESEHTFPAHHTQRSTSTSDQTLATMNLGDGDLRLLCVIEGETEVFQIDIEGSSWRNPKFMVGDLKKRIQEEQKFDSLAGVGAHILVLWKVCHQQNLTL
jgi:hypothetical protein